MPYHPSSDEEMHTASSAATRHVHRPLRGLRRRRGDINSDSSDENDNNYLSEDLDRLKTSQSTRKMYREDTEILDSNQMSPRFQEGEELQQSQTQTQTERNLILEDPDSNTMRILISTDNHLGFAENDNVRGNDSFAALEEVLYLAKEYSCDMVLLAGDLFHENRPSRRTLYKTMDIFRRYCMGPGAIQVQVVSGSTSPRNGARSTTKNSNENNRSPFVRGYVNYEDANYSVDLPIFSIHGNHDDPSRDGGNSELYAALDLLDIANLVNYFGKQEDTTNIRVDPILLRKGSTQVALYGLGSMRDERLNRMWRGGHLTFSRPAETTTSNNDENTDNPSWFNIFALHQNRDRGRGAKNCVKEDMIPEWIDFVCWGHEHECDIELTESVVGTFRISQPGSSVATSLGEGESVRKKVAVLDVREGQFRLTSIPLTQVRSFVVSTVRLANEPRLDPDDPKVEAKVAKVLEEKVRVLIHDAREKRRELLKDAKTGGNGLAAYCEKNVSDSTVGEMPLKHTLQKEDEVLVRLKVDHTGFATVNNQRFGAKFVGDVANPTDILLFQRKKTEAGGSYTKSINDIAPIEPSEIEEMNIEELIVEQFESNTSKLELFDDKKISLALDSYVGKQEARAINEALEKLLGKQQNRLIKNGIGPASEEGTTRARHFDENEVVEGSKRKTKKGSMHDRNHDPDDDDYEVENKALGDSPVAKSRSTKRASQSSTASRKRTTSSRRNTSYDDSDNDELGDRDTSKVKPNSNHRTASSRTNVRHRRAAISYEESEGESDDIQVADPPLRNRRKTNPTRKRSAKKTVDYSINDSDKSSDDDDVLVVDNPSPPKKKRGKGRSQVMSTKTTSAANRRSRGSIESSGGLSQTRLSFKSIKPKATREQTPKFKRTAHSRSTGNTNDDSESDSGDSFTLKSRSYYDDGDDWGTAKSGGAN